MFHYFSRAGLRKILVPLALFSALLVLLNSFLLGSVSANIDPQCQNFPPPGFCPSIEDVIAIGVDENGCTIWGCAQTCGGFTATIVGTEGDDLLKGTPGVDVIVGLGGNDTIFGYEGNDVICGNDGDDMIFGGKGDDYLDGQIGEDMLNGGKDFDKCGNFEKSGLCELDFWSQG